MITGQQLMQLNDLWQVAITGLIAPTIDAYERARDAQERLLDAPAFARDSQLAVLAQQAMAEAWAQGEAESRSLMLSWPTVPILAEDGHQLGVSCWPAEA